MLLIKQLYKKIFAQDNKDKQDTDIDFDKDTVVMSVGLTPDYEIDLSVHIKELSIANKTDFNIKAQKIATFFYTITSGGLNKTIVEFLVDILPDRENKELFESILYHWLLLEQNQKKTQQKYKESPLIEPSKAFIPYYTNTNK